MICAVPTQEDIDAADKAVKIAFAEYTAADLAGQDVVEPLIVYCAAIEHALTLQYRRDHAVLVGAYYESHPAHHTSRTS